MAEKPPLPVRFDQATIDRLDKMSVRLGTNRAALIRFCTQTFLSHLEKRGSAMLPPDWESIVHAMDGRRAGSSLAEDPGPSTAAPLPQKPVKYTAKKARRKKNA